MPFVPRADHGGFGFGSGCERIQALRHRRSTTPSFSVSAGYAAAINVLSRVNKRSRAIATLAQLSLRLFVPVTAVLRLDRVWVYANPQAPPVASLLVCPRRSAVPRVSAVFPDNSVARRSCDVSSTCGVRLGCRTCFSVAVIDCLVAGMTSRPGRGEQNA